MLALALLLAPEFSSAGMVERTVAVAVVVAAVAMVVS